MNVSCHERHPRGSRKRTDEGAYRGVPLAQAVDEASVRLRQIVAEHGPGSVALLVGAPTHPVLASHLTPLSFPVSTHSHSPSSSPVGPRRATASASLGPNVPQPAPGGPAGLVQLFATAFADALGTTKVFSACAVDDSAARVAAARLGTWLGGRQRFEDSDVWLLAGANPLLAAPGRDGAGFTHHTGPRPVRDARLRGMKLVVVDPHRSDTARHADLHLALAPGTDAVLFAGLLHVVLNENLFDQDFCDRYTVGLPALWHAVRHATPAFVAATTGLTSEQVVAAGRTFGTASSGMATTGAGANTGAWSNLVEHLAQALNVVCGRFPRAGESGARTATLPARHPLRAQVRSPGRSRQRPERTRGSFAAHGPDADPPDAVDRRGPVGPLPSAGLPDQILATGPDRIRALVVVGSDPAGCLPNRARAVRALSALDLLVTVESPPSKDAVPSETSRLAHYVVAQVRPAERIDDGRPDGRWFAAHHRLWTDPLLYPPVSEVGNGRFFLDLAAAMGLTLRIGQHSFAPGDPPPSSEQLLAAATAATITGAGADSRTAWDRAEADRATVPRHLDLFDLPLVTVQPGDDGSAEPGRFELCPPDVADELAAALAS